MSEVKSKSVALFLRFSIYQRVPELLSVHVLKFTKGHNSIEM